MPRIAQSLRMVWAVCTTSTLIGPTVVAQLMATKEYPPKVPKPHSHCSTLCLGFDALLCRGPTADLTRRKIMVASRTVITTEEDYLQMTSIPGFFWEDSLEIAFGLRDVRAVGEPPAISKAMDVRIDRKRRHTKRLRHNDACRLVPHTRERFEKLPVADDLAARVEDLVSHRGQVASLGRRQSDLADELKNPFRIHRGHRLGRTRLGEERRRDFVDLLVGGLGRERNRHGQRVRVGVVERDRRLGIQVVEDLADLYGLVSSLHVTERGSGRR